MAMSVLAVPALAQTGQPSTPAPTTPPASPPPATTPPPAAPPAASAETLYKRLGGYDAIAAVTDDFLARLAGDPSLGRFFTGFSNDSKRKIRQLIVDQLCQVSGGPCYYIGRSMKTAHAGLNISEADWTTAVGLLNATFDKFQVPQKERDEVLAAITGMKADMVTAK
jgi:hemoglobin